MNSRNSAVELIDAAHIRGARIHANTMASRLERIGAGDRGIFPAIFASPAGTSGCGNTCRTDDWRYGKHCAFAFEVESSVSGVVQSELQSIDGVVLRPLGAADLPAAHALSEAVRWPHRLVDWEFALDLGEGLAALRDDELIGTALAWRWGPRHATLGLVSVAGRGQVIGPVVARQFALASQALG